MRNKKTVAIECKLLLISVTTNERATRYRAESAYNLNLITPLIRREKGPIKQTPLSN